MGAWELLWPIVASDRRLTAMQVQRSLVHEAFPPPKAPAQGEGGPGSARGYHEAAEDGRDLVRNRLGHRQVCATANYTLFGLADDVSQKMYHCRLLPPGGEGQGHWRVHERPDRGEWRTGTGSGTGR
jgi:hypothetical protein